MHVQLYSTCACICSCILSMPVYRYCTLYEWYFSFTKPHISRVLTIYYYNEYFYRHVWPVHACSVHVWPVHACSVHVWPVHACSVHVWPVHACSVHVWPVHACSVHVWPVHACSVHVWPVHACSVHIRNYSSLQLDKSHVMYVLGPPPGICSNTVGISTYM